MALIESQAIHLTSPDPVVRQTAREAVRSVLITYREMHTPDPAEPVMDSPEQIAARRAAISDLRGRMAGRAG